MSKKYPGGIIRGTPVVPAGPYQDGSAPGTWTLDQATNYIKQGIWPLAGNVNPNAFIENLFQTWLYTGTGATQTITNGIDLSTYGGLVWRKGRAGTYSTDDHILIDTVRGRSNCLATNATFAQFASASREITSFNANGFTIPPGDTNGYPLNTPGTTYVSWTFRKQPKFFDVVTYTGDGVAGRTVAHSLGSVPGCIIIKSTDNTSVWFVYHRSVGNTGILQLQSTAATATSSTYWNNTDPTSTQFTLGGGSINAGGAQYVAYLFAHNAGGFGSSNADNVISCGSFTADGSGNATVNLGYEPQFIIQKLSSGTGNWETYDIMRGWSQTQIAQLYPNLSSAEGGGTATFFFPTATGFQWVGGALTAGGTYIYIAIRRGPMKTPTTGTSVFDVDTQTGGGFVTTNFPVDLTINTRQGSATAKVVSDRLRGGSVTLDTTSTAAESNFGSPPVFGFTYNTGIEDDYWGASAPSVYWNFRRAPGFFDEVCYTGTGSGAQTLNHNLGAVPELMITRARNSADDWYTYAAATGNTKCLFVNYNLAEQGPSSTYWNNTSPTSTQFTVGSARNGSATYVAYLFASCPGVSKVGSYTGTGALQTINCGFTSGARFVLIKRTDSTGDWYVYDSARGITSGNDPYLLLNSNAAEVTSTNYVDTDTTGFKVTAAAPAGLNASGGTYIFLAIA